MKVYYIAWNGEPCDIDGNAYQKGRAKLDELEVYLSLHEAEQQLKHIHTKWHNINAGFTIQEVE